MLDFQISDSLLPPVKEGDTLRALSQTPEFERALRANGQEPLVLKDMDNTLVTRRWLNAGITLAMVNRAQISQPQSLVNSLRANGLGRTPVILSPDRPTPQLGQIGALALVSPAHVAVLDLLPDQEQRHAALHQKWRNRLTRSQSHGASQHVRTSRQNMPVNPDHWLFSADLAQQISRGYRSWPVALTLAYAQQNKGQAKLFQAFEGKEVIAAVLILRHGAAATYHIAHSSARGKALSAHNLLMWDAMSWLASKGCRHLDLGVINTEEAPGLARFKLGTGARLIKLGGTWLLWPPMGRILSPLARFDRKRMSATSR